MKLTLISMAVMLSFYAIQCVANEDFVEVPETQTVYEQEQAVFRCRHTLCDREIQWRVNGTPVGLNAPPEINPGFERDENENLVDTLTITATPDYNNSVVVCVSRIEGQSTSTPPAILRVLPRPSPPQTGFTLVPESQNTTIGGTAQFTCERMDGDVVWRIDGQSVNDVNVMATNQAGVYTLTFLNASQKYNGSEIQCKAMFEDTRAPEFTSTAILQLQGPLDPVSNVRLDRDSSTLSWTPPFSLDLTGVDPDIAYCVDIYNITCGRRDLIISDCNVTEPSYSSSTPDGYIYEYVVTPRSNVEGARNGTPNQPLRERFSRFNSVPTTNVQLAFLNLEPNRPVPSSYTVILESLDGLEDVVLKTTSVTTEGDVIVVDVDHRLPLNRLWNGALLAYGCRQNTILSDIELSTHDIQNVSVSSRIPGQVSVTGEFIQGSMATGVLVTIVNATYLEHHLISRDDSGNGIDGVISGLPGGQYTVSVFVVGEDDLPFERVATKPRRITVENAAGPVGDHPSPAIKYKLDQTSSEVCITCTFLNSSATDCVAVVHQRISQLSSSGLMNIESSHKFTRSGDTAYGCIEGVNLEQYQVGVIGGKMIIMEPNTSSSIDAITIGAVLAAAFFILVSTIVIVVILIYVVLQWKKTYRGKALFNDRKSSKQVDVLKLGYSPHVGRNLYTPWPMPNVERTSKETTSVTTESSDPEGTDNPQPDSSTFPPSSSPTPQAAAVECTREEVASITTKLRYPNDPQPDSSSSLPTSSLVPVMPQGTVATHEAEGTEFDKVPSNPGTPADNKPTVGVEGFNNSQELCVEGTATTGKHEQDHTTLYSSSPPKDDPQPSQSLLETSFTTLKEQALPLDDSEVSHRLDINIEKDEACTVTDENMETVSEDGNTNKLQDKETQPVDNHYPTEESVSGDDLDATAVSEYGSKPHEPVAQSTPLKPDRPSISGVSAQYVSDVSESVSDQSSGTNMFVQSLRMYKLMADHTVSKGSTCITDPKGLSDTENADGKDVPQPVISKADARVPEDDSAYDTFTMTDSSDSSEPYSEISNHAESGCDTNLVITIKEINEFQIVCGLGKTPDSVLMNEDHDGGETVSHHLEDMSMSVQPMMGNREQQQLGIFNANHENIVHPLVPPHNLDQEIPHKDLSKEMK